MCAIEKAHRLLAPRIVYLVGTCAADGTANMIPVSNITSISTDPQQLAVAVYKQWTTRHTLLTAAGFTLSVPHSAQLPGVWKLGAKYSRFPCTSNAEKIRASGLHMDCSVSSYGPVLVDGIGWLAVKMLQNLDFGGDHTLFIGQIEEVSFNPDVLSADGKPRGETHPVMQVTGNIFTTSSETRTIPYFPSSVADQ